MERSPLNTLPPKLRNCIYELALTHTLPIAMGTATAGDGDISKEACHGHPSPLTRTCKAIRAECIQVYYASNTFIIPTGKGPVTEKLRPVKRFRRMIGPQSSAALRQACHQAPGHACRAYVGLYCRKRWACRNARTGLQKGEKPQLLFIQVHDFGISQTTATVRSGSGDRHAQPRGTLQCASANSQEQD